MVISFGEKNKKPKPKKKKKQHEFMQKMLIILIFVSIVFTSFSYILSYFDKNPVEQLSIEIIRTLWLVDGVGIGAYAMQNSMRAKWYGDKTASKKINNESDDINDMG